MISCFWQNAEIFHTDIKKKKNFQKNSLPKGSSANTTPHRTRAYSHFMLLLHGSEPV